MDGRYGISSEGRAESLSDAALVQEAQRGGREAFGELFRRHHARAYGIARSIVQDAFAADDIVQEALVRAFLHLGTLMDAERFLPWLHRIVRNQAYNRLKASKRERPISDMIIGPAVSGGMRDSRTGELERLIDRLREREREAPEGSDPAVRMVRRELYETIRELLHCLSKRERQFFEAYFFEQLTPKEIADANRTTTGNVYMVLSRSKSKLTDERIRRDLDRYISYRKLGGRMGKRILNKPRVLHWKSPFPWSYEPWTTAGFNMYGLLEATGRHDLSIAQVLGLTGQSFRLTVVRDSIHTSGATRYDWNAVLPEAMRNLGLQCRIVSGGTAAAGRGEEPAVHPSETLEQAAKLIQDAVDRGHYAMSFDLTLPEFGIIYGYDDHSREFYVGDVNVSFHRKAEEHERLPYERLGRTVTGLLFVMTVTGTMPMTKDESLNGAVRMILAHARGEEPAQAGCANGLAAYDVWMEAFRNRTVDRHGNSYTTELAHDARRYAVQFLEETAAERTEAGDIESAALLLEAARHYARCAEAFRGLCGMFPFDGEQSTPNEPRTAERAIELLQEACAAERDGLAVMERLAVRLKQP